MPNKIIRNIKLMGLMQIANYLLPLVYIPIISRIIGPEKFGIINYTATLVAYFTIFISFGFEYSAIRIIAADPENKDLINKTFNRVFNAQIFLSLIIFLVYILTLMTIASLYANKTIYSFTVLTCIATLFSQNWIFQAKQEFSKIVILTLSAKIITTLLLLLIVRKADDFYFIALLTSLINIVTAFISFYWTLTSNQIKLRLIKINEIINTLKASLTIFLSQFMIGLYNNFNIVYLGVFHSALSVGYYTSGQKLIGITQMIVSLPINTALYPVFSKKFASNKNQAIQFLQGITPVLFIILVILCTLNFVFAPYTIKFLYGSQFSNSIVVLQILSFVPLLSFFNNFLGVNILLNLKMDKAYLIITAISGSIGISTNIILSNSLSYISAAIAWNVAEILSLLFFILKLRKEGIIVMKIQDLKNLSKITNSIKSIRTNA